MSITWSETVTNIVFQKIASSYSGSNVASISSDSLYISNDYGASWNLSSFTVEKEENQLCIISGVAMSSDSSKLAVCVNNNYIYTSNNSGQNWTKQISSESKNWIGICSSSDGSKLAAITSQRGSSIMEHTDPVEAYVSISTDSGVTWAVKTSSGNKKWTDITMSSDGSKIYACCQNDYIYISEDGGDTWTANTQAGQKEWKNISVSSDGLIMLAVSVNPCILYSSTDGGATWDEVSCNIWSGCSVSPNGNMMAACVDNKSNGYVYTSTDGINWTCHNELGPKWYDRVALNQTGSKIFVTHHNDNMFVGDIS